jgi:transposase
MTEGGRRKRRVITMELYEAIRMANRVEKKGIRAIARQFGVHRRTVRKALQGIVPEYRRKSEPVRPVMDEVSPIIRGWLEEDKTRPAKQRHTAHRIYRRLAEEYAFGGAETTVRRFVRECRGKMGEGRINAVIPLDPEIAREAEVDWGEAAAIVAGKERVLKLFAMRPRYSGKLFVQAYVNEKQEMFFDGHMRAFAYFGGVFETIVYDNLKAAVKKVLVGRGRIEQERFLAFRGHYTFKARFCNPSISREKGGVEGAVGYSRRNFMVPVPAVDSLEELNELLLARCLAHDEHVLQGREDQRTIAERHAEERTRLLALPESAFENAKKLRVVIDRYSTGRLETNRYSVPTEHVGRALIAHVEPWTVSIYDGCKRVARHARQFGRNGWQLDPMHYLDLVERRIGSFESARSIRQWRESWPDEYEILLEKLMERHGEDSGKREFVGILLLHKEHTKQQVESAVRDALALNAIGVEPVRHLITRSESLEESAARFESPLCLANLLVRQVKEVAIAPPDIARYDALLDIEKRGEAA